MSKNRITYEVLIASPSDLSEERKAARETITDWNSLHSRDMKVNLQPLMFEHDATPEFGDPQLIINKQLLENADIVVVFFWTNLGTATERAESGTVEEINEAVKAGKDVMVYFSDRPKPPSQIDPKQIARLNEYKAKISNKALHGKFNSIENLKAVLKDDLTRRVRMMLSKQEVASAVTHVIHGDHINISGPVMGPDHSIAPASAPPAPVAFPAYQLSRNELRLLGYLHANAKGYDDRFQFRPADICKALSIKPEQLNADSSFMASNGLLGIKSLNMTTFATADVGNHNIVGIWLTGNGERLMRTLENALDEQLQQWPDYVAATERKLNEKAAGFLWDTAKHHTTEVISAWIEGRPVAKRAESEEPNEANRNLMSVEVRMKTYKHHRVLYADVINKHKKLNNVHAICEFGDKSLQMGFDGKLPEPFEPDFSGSFCLANDEPHKIVNALTMRTPDRIFLVIKSGVRELIRLPATQWLQQLEEFRQPNINLPAKPVTHVPRSVSRDDR